MIKVKPGVTFGPEGSPPIIAPAGFIILEALKTATKRLGRDLTITSAWDGDHSGPTDPHKLGEAFDVRSHDFEDRLKHMVLDAIMSRLDPLRFYGFLEAPQTKREHFHIQRKKGTTFSVEDFLNA